jgi:hypothetical protein
MYVASSSFQLFSENSDQRSILLAILLAILCSYSCAPYQLYTPPLHYADPRPWTRARGMRTVPAAVRG